MQVLEISYAYIFLGGFYPEKLEDQWWQIILLEKKSGKIEVSFLNVDLKNDPGFIFKAKSDSYYLDSQWTKQDVLHRIQAGDFSNTVMDLEKSKSRKR